MLAAFLALGPAPAAVDEAEVQALVVRARRGDGDAARALYRLHVHRVWRAVRPLAGGEAEAEDAVQETFIRAFGSLGRYRPRPGVRFVAWLLTIAVHEARRRARRRRETLLTPAEAAGVAEAQGPGGATGAAGTAGPDGVAGAAVRDGSSGAGPEQAALSAERARMLLEALAELPERDRRVVSLRYGAGLEAREVARAAGLSTANVRKICERTRRRLADRLAPLEGET